MINSKRYLSAGIVFIVFCIVLTLIKCSNEKKPETETQGDVHYAFDWSNALPGHSLPNRLRYCFYPLNGGSVIQMDYGTGELNFILPPDDYKILIFNCDAGNIAFRNMDKYETAEAFIPETKANDGTQSGITPLYGIATEILEIKAGDNSPIKFTPQPLVRSISISIKVKGMEHVAECCGSISGMSAALNLSRQIVMPDATTDVSFKATPSADGVKVNIMMLGKPKEKDDEQPAAPPHEVTLDFTLTDGSTASTSIDLGNSIEETEGNNIDVTIEATVEKSPTFTVRINHWEVLPGDSLIIE